VLFRNARPLFKDALDGPQFFEEGPVAVVFAIVNDLVLVLAGTDECDALLCTCVGVVILVWGKGRGGEDSVVSHLIHIPISTLCCILSHFHYHQSFPLLSPLHGAVMELLDSPLRQLLRLACEKHAGKGEAAAGDEASFLHVDSYGKWACLLDEFVPAGGVVEHVEVEVIEKLAKAKPLA
jgi:hypothetical protein